MQIQKSSLALFLLIAATAMVPALSAAEQAESGQAQIEQITGRSQSQASALVFSAQLDEAKSEYKKALDTYQELLNIYTKDPGLGADSARAAWALAKMSYCQARLGRIEQAAKSAKDSLNAMSGLNASNTPKDTNYLVTARELCRAVLGKSMPGSAAKQKNPALKPFVLCDLENMDESAKLVKQILARSEKTKESSSLEYAKRTLFLANVYTIKKRYAEAEPLFKKALAAFEKRSGKMSPYLIEPLSNYGYMLEQSGRKTEAEQVLSRLATISKYAI